MSSAVLPTLAGLGFSVKRIPVWSTRIQTAISGKKTRIADWSYPVYQWELTYDFLRQAGTAQQVTTYNGSTYSEFATLAGFFNQRQGQFDSFLYLDPDDNTSATDQSLGVGDGATTLFQLVRVFGGYAEPVLAPNVVTNVKVNGVTKTLGSDYDVTLWNLTYLSGAGASPNLPGMVSFTVAPPASQSVTATFTFYFPCSFLEDHMDFEKFMAPLYSAKSVKFESRKN
jgi:uncharacterized protein (TIGR02217 family)